MSFMGLDLGTTMCKAAAFSEDGACIAIAHREYDIRRPSAGRAELDAGEVWSKGTEVIAEVASAAKHDPVRAIGFSSMGEALVPISADRHVMGRSILCFDERGGEFADTLASRFSREAFYRINGNRIGPQFGLPKLLWIRENERESYERTARFLPWSDAAAHLLGADACITDSHASRLLLLDVQRGELSDEILSWAGVPHAKLGRVVPGGTVVGEVSRPIAATLGLPAGVTLVAGGHDQCCTATGCGCIEPGQALCGLGTFQCIAPVFLWPADPLAMMRCSLNIENHAVAGRYIAFLYNQAGSLVKWFRDTFATHERDGSGDVYAKLNAELPGGPTSLLVLPHFEPPVWPELIARTAGAIVGLRTTTTRGDILKAILECTSLYFVPGVKALAAMGMPIRSLTAVGGGAKSDAWMQINADVLGVPVVRPRTTEAGLAGAAMLAGMAVRRYASAAEAAGCFVRTEREFQPDGQRHAAYVVKSEKFQRLYPAVADLLI